MPSREQTIADAIRVFDSAVYPTGLDLTSAWLGIYQTLLWYEPVNWVGFDRLPHIIDADKLRPTREANKQSWREPKPWQRRADAINQYLAANLHCPMSAVEAKTDLLMKKSDYAGMQRQNTLGIAFAGLVQHVLEKFGPQTITYKAEVEASEIFPNIALPGRSAAPRIDVVATENGVPRAVISSKWSVRHDRINDLTNECPVYKGAHLHMYGQTQHKKLLYFVATNEFDPARLSKMMSDPCIDGVVHVHKAGVVNVCGMNGRMGALIDLADFVSNRLR